MYQIFVRFLREKLVPIEQHKPQISENSFFKKQHNIDCCGLIEQHTRPKFLGTPSHEYLWSNL